MKSSRTLYFLLPVWLALAACSDDGQPENQVAAPAPVVIRQAFCSPMLSPAAEDLPLLSVATEDARPVLSREEYVHADWQLDLPDGGHQSGELEIRGRGSSTWGMPKQPWRLKLEQKTALLGMPADRNWVLLANYADKTLLRNALAFELSRQMSFAWTPRYRHVELYLNDDYLGVYQLVEHIRVGENRVAIPELKASDTSPEKITGGYLMEVDVRRGEDFCVTAARSGMVFCLASPDTLAEPGREAQRDYIANYLAATDAAMFGDDFADPAIGYAAWIDVASLVDYYLAQEVLRNVDGDLRLSTYIYKPRDGKLTFGPLWDFDIAAGNSAYGDGWRTSGWQLRNAPWFQRLFTDPAFAARVRARWRELYDAGVFRNLRPWISAEAGRLDAAQRRNFARWPILDIWVWPNADVTGSYCGEVDYLQQWLTQRISWMDRQFQ